MRSSSMIKAVILSGLASQISMLHADSAYNMTRGVTTFSGEVYDLHMLIFWICVFIGVGVFSVMFYSLLKHRKSQHREPSEFHEHTGVEVVWTIIPLLILLGMAIPATKVLLDIDDASDPDHTVTIIGHQWYWQYKYNDSDVVIYSRLSTPEDEINNLMPKTKDYLRQVDNPLVLPTNAKVRLYLTSDDVIHSWWVPDFGFKKDTIPGYINESWVNIEKPGVYVGACAELCGRLHGFMPIVVDAKSPEDYEAWLSKTAASQEEERQLATQTFTKDELMARGEEIYGNVCAACHGPAGEGVGGIFPALAGEGISVDKDKLNEHIQIVWSGKAGTAMQAFAEQLGPLGVAAVVTYERNAWGNDTDQIVQPLEAKQVGEDGGSV